MPLNIQQLKNDLRTTIRGIPQINADQITKALPMYLSNAMTNASRFIPTVKPDWVTPEDFDEKHGAAWKEAFTNLRDWKDSTASMPLPREKKQLIIGWYFPELVTLLNAAKRNNVLVLVSQDAPWLEELKEAGCTLNFLAPGNTRSLMTEMQRGRNIFAILDNIHSGTEVILAPFLGRPVRTPAGILKLAIAHSYTLLFIAPRHGQVEIVNSAEAANRKVLDLATQVNGWIEAEVARAPHRWMMWTALPSRWEDQ